MFQFHFGQPSAGLLLDRDFFTRSFQLPFSFNLSAFGPGVAFFSERFELLATFFFFNRPRVFALRFWVLIPQTSSFG